MADPVYHEYRLMMLGLKTTQHIRRGNITIATHLMNMTARSLATTTATVGFLTLEMFQEIDILQMMRASDTIEKIALVLNAQSGLLNSCTASVPYWHQLTAEHYFYRSRHECSQLQAQVVHSTTLPALQPIESSRVLLKHARLVYPEKSETMIRYFPPTSTRRSRSRLNISFPLANIVVLLQVSHT